MNPATIRTGCRLNCFLGSSRQAKPSLYCITQNRVKPSDPNRRILANTTTRVYSNQLPQPHSLSSS